MKLKSTCQETSTQMLTRIPSECMPFGAFQESMLRNEDIWTWVRNEESFSVGKAEEDHHNGKALHILFILSMDIWIILSNCITSSLWYYCVMSIFTSFRMLPWSWYHFLNKDLGLFVSYQLMEWFQMLHFVSKILLGVLWLMRSSTFILSWNTINIDLSLFVFFNFITLEEIRYWILLVLRMIRNSFT